MHAHAFEKQNVCSQRQTNSTVAVQSLEIDYYASLGVVRVMRVMRVLRVFHCFSSLNAFYSMLVYKLSNNISLIHNPCIYPSLPLCIGQGIEVKDS